MSLKRIKNKKLEPNEQYPIYIYDTLIEEKIQDYEQAQFNTGMEEEEKQEHHLKSALENEQSVIPTPQIIEVDRIKEPEIYKKPKDLIKYNEDIQNTYVISEEDQKFIENNDLNVNVFLDAVEKIRDENEKYIKLSEDNKTNPYIYGEIDLDLRNYLKERLLMLYDETEFDLYACFRKRVIKAGRKSRKFDTSCAEKLKRIWSEINLIEKLCELSLMKYDLEKEYIETKREIVKAGNKLIVNSGRKDQKKIIDKILGKKKKVKEDLFYKKYTFKELIGDRNKINELKTLLKKRKIEDKDLEDEVEILMKIKRQRK